MVKIRNNKKIYFFLALLMIGVFTLPIPKAQGAVGDGIIIYDETAPSANVQTRSWTESATTVSSETSPFDGTGVSKHISAVGSPTRQEMLLGIEDSAGTLTIYKSTDNGANWVSQWSFTVGDGNLQRFDIGYEQTSGDALVVYSANAAAANEIRYQTWNGTSWSGELNFDPIRTTGTVYGIKIAERSGSNEIGVVWADTNFDLSANVWTGSAWYGEPSAALATNISRIGANTVPTNRAYDLAFESISGELMVLWGIDATADPRFVMKAPGGAWGAVQTATNLIEEPTMLDIAPSPISDKIAYSNNTDIGNDCDFAVWSGTAWGTAANDTTCGVIAIGDSGNNVDWLADDANEVAIFTYNDSATGRIDWYQSTNGSTPTLQTDITDAPAVLGAERATFAKISPNDGKQGLFFFEDANADIFLKKTSLSGTAVTWTSVEPGAVAIEINTSVIGFNPIGFAYTRFQSTTLTVGVSGNQAVSLISGDINQHIGGAATAAFTLQISNGSASLASVKITDTGDATLSALTSMRLFYEGPSLSCSYDGAESFVSGTPTGESVTFTLPSISIAVSPNITCLYPVFTLNGDETGTKGGQTIDFEITNPSTDVSVTGAVNTDTSAKLISGTTTIKPNATGVTYGSGLFDGGRSGETITISGYGFGSATGAGRAICNGSVDTGCARFIVNGTDTIADSDISAWSNTAITFAINPLLGSKGGASALEMVSGNQSDESPLSFFIYPNITGMITCASGGNRDNPCGTNSAEEYVAGDTFGLIQLNGDHFDTSAGAVNFTGAFGTISGVIHGTGEGACATAGWGSIGTGTSVCVEVSSAIADNVYDGAVTLARTDSKTDIIDLHILPRISENAPSADVVGSVITIDGDHFCQTGSCPITPPDADYIAFFGGTQALTSDFVTSCSGGSRWSHTEVCVKVPAAAPSGAQKTKIHGFALPLYESERKNFTVLSTMPDDPINLAQFKSNGTTAILPPPFPGATNESSVVLKADLSATISINMALQVEVKPTTTLFDEIGIVQGVSPEGACASCASLTAASVAVSGLADGAKHWRARTTNTTTSENSAWISFGANLETDADFFVDTTAPSITFPPGDTCADAISSSGTNSATINWSLDESGDGQVEYSINSDLSQSAFYPTPPAEIGVSHAITLINLNSGTTYFFRVKSQDAAGNLSVRPASSPFCFFTTGSVTQPGKTTIFHITSNASILSSASDFYFTVLAPENVISVKDAYARISAIVSGGANLEIAVNGVAAKNYTVSATVPTLYTLIYPISNPESESNLNFNDDIPCTNGNSFSPPCNKFTITPGLGMNLYATSADIAVTYGYNP